MFLFKKKNDFSRGNKALLNDYKDWIQEFSDEIEDGNLSFDTYIDIVRDEEIWISDTESYCPIIDYYELKDEDYYSKTLDLLYDCSNYSDAEWESMLKEHEEGMNQYIEDMPNSERVKLSDVLDEIEAMIAKLTKML